MCGMGPVVNKSLVDQARTEQAASTTAPRLMQPAPLAVVAWLMEPALLLLQAGYTRLMQPAPLLAVFALLSGPLGCRSTQVMI